MIHSQFLEACLDNEIEIVRALLAEDVRLVNSLSEDCRYSALAIAVRHHLHLRSGDAASINVNQTNLTFLKSVQQIETGGNMTPRCWAG